MEVRHYKIIKNKFNLENKVFWEVIFIHKYDSSKILLIFLFNRNYENYTKIEYREFKRRYKSLQLTYSLNTFNTGTYYKHYKDDDEFDLLNSTNSVSLILINHFNINTKTEKIACLIALFMRINNIEFIYQHQLILLNKISKNIYLDCEFLEVLNNSPLFLKEKDKFWFFSKACIGYFVCKEFCNFENDNYSGSFKGLLPFNYFQLINFKNIPKELEEIVQEIHDTRSAKLKAIIKKEYELAADLREKENNYLKAKLELKRDDILHL